MTQEEFEKREDVIFHRTKAALARQNYIFSDEAYHNGRLIELYDKYVKGGKE